MRELGYVEGQNITFERRFAAGRAERLSELVADLVRLKVDLVVATGFRENQAAKQAMPTTPIVMMVVADPVGAGLVASLARPGGNVTGLSTIAIELIGKRIELLKETIPKATRMALLLGPRLPLTDLVLTETDTAARALGVRLRVFEVRGVDELDGVYSAMTRERVEALLVPLHAEFMFARSQIADLAAKSGLPAMYDVREFVEAGGLMAYGASVSDLSRRAAVFVDKILKGAKPADLPVEQPTKFELIINGKTAKALGLTIPQSILLRTDKVIQ
jgi:putative ABC transport system substrate-binding protein